MRERARYQAAAVLLGVLAATLAAGCNEQVTGSGRVVAERVRVRDFKRLEVGTAFRVRVRLAGREGLVLRVDDNLRDLVVARARQGVLSIHLKPGVLVGRATLEADVSARVLDAIQAGDASEVQVTGTLAVPKLYVELRGASRLAARVRAGELESRLAGASRLRLGGRAGRCRLRAQGASELDLGGLRARRLEAELTGASRARAWVSGPVAADLAGASVLTLAGTPRLTRLDLTGASTVERVGWSGR